MKNRILVGMMLLTSSLSARIHDLAGRTGDIIIGNSDKQFVIYNHTTHPYELYVRMEFGGHCRFEAFSNFRAGRVIVEKAAGCIPSLVSGYLIDPDDRNNPIPLVRWPQGRLSPFGAHAAGYGAVWTIEMNPDRKSATVHFRRGLHSPNAAVD